MQIKKSVKLLKKINSVFNNIVEDSESVSKLEQELLKSYVIQFYDSIIEEKESVISSKKVAKQPEKAPKVQESKEQRILAAAEVSQVSAASVKKEVTPDPFPAAKPVVEIEPEPTPITETEVKIESQPITAPASKGQNGHVLDPMFQEVAELQNNSHIGERLITDFKKAMGLNDKLRYANTLFGAKQSRMLEVLEKLNAAANISNAKDILTPIAAEFEWLDSEKHESAIGFLTLVHRKFNKS